MNLEGTKQNEIDKKTLTRNVYKRHFIEDFEKKWEKLGRKIMFSENLSFYRKNYLIYEERQKEYVSNAIELICTVGTHKPIIKSESEFLGFDECKRVFENIKSDLIKNPKMRGKYVAIVNGEIIDTDEQKVRLVKKMYDTFGNVEMFVDKVESKRSIGMIKSPRIK